jgi:hypothetical protein
MVVGTNAGPLDAMSFVIADIVISLVVAAVTTTVKMSITTISTIATANEPVGQIDLIQRVCSLVYTNMAIIIQRKAR